MSIRLPKLEELERDFEVLIAGYIREIQPFLSHQVPIITNQLTISYYDSSDKWDKECIGDHLTIINKSFIRADENCRNAVSLSQKITSLNKYKWKFHILNTNKILNLDIGVYKVNDINVPNPNNFWVSGPQQMYAIDVITGKKIEPIHGRLQEFGTKCSNDCGDFIDMILDLNIFTLSYAINGNNHKISHRVERAEYKAFIMINYIGTGKKTVIELLQSTFI